MAPTGAARSAPSRRAKANARDVAYRAGVRHIGMEEMTALQAQADRTLYRFDVRSAEEYAAGHLAGFRHYPGGQLVQEIDMAAPVRGARIVLTDNQARPRRHDRVLARADGMGNLRARRRL